jgi:hypothetical protein
MAIIKSFPTKEKQLNEFFQRSVAYLLANQSRLRIGTMPLMYLPSHLADWTNALAQDVSKAKKDEACDMLKQTLRSFYADKEDSLFTEDDYAALNIAPAPVPTTKPVVTKVDTERRPYEHTVHFTDEDGNTDMPAGMCGCQIWVKFGAPTKDPKELLHLNTSIKTPYRYSINESHAKEHAHYWLRWENTRGETGPWSDVVKAIVKGDEWT